MPGECVIKTTNTNGPFADKVCGPFPNKQAAEKHLESEGWVKLDHAMLRDVWFAETQLGNVTVKVVLFEGIEGLPDNCVAKKSAEKFRLVPAAAKASMSTPVVSS